MAHAQPNFKNLSLHRLQCAAAGKVNARGYSQNHLPCDYSMSKTQIAVNILIFTALIATASLGWLAGHIIRFSIPEFWHPPLEERIPGEKIGSLFQVYTPQILGRVPITNWEVNIWQGCKTDVYYTSLPAKCRSMDGRLVRVVGGQREIFIFP